MDDNVVRNLLQSEWMQGSRNLQTTGYGRQRNCMKPHHSFSLWLSQVGEPQRSNLGEEHCVERGGLWKNDLLWTAV